MKKCTTDALSIIEKLSDIFKSEGVPLWVDSGTLLGLIREGDLIHWDDDVDLGTFDTLVSGKILDIQKRLAQHGYYSLATDSKLSFNGSVDGKIMPFNVSIYKEKGGVYFTQFHVPVTGFKKLISVVVMRFLSRWRNYRMKCLMAFDIERGDDVSFFFDLQVKVNRVAKLTKIARRVLTSSAFSLNVKEVVIPPGYFDSLGSLKLDGFEIVVPSSYEDYLSLRYGAGWRKPRREWLHWAHDKAIR